MGMTKIRTYADDIRHSSGASAATNTIGNVVFIDRGHKTNCPEDQVAFERHAAATEKSVTEAFGMLQASYGELMRKLAADE